MGPHANRPVMAAGTGSLTRRRMKSATQETRPAQNAVDTTMDSLFNL